MIFFVVLLIGADILQFNIGVSIRIDQILAAAVAVWMMAKKRYKLPMYKSFLCFAVFSFISCFLSIYKEIGFAYVLWIVFDYICIFGVIYSYILHRGINKFYGIFRTTMYVQVALIVIQFIFELIGCPISFFRSGTFLGIPRPAIWFYETSYFATYLTFWLVVSIFMAFYDKRKKYLYDTFAAILGIVFCTSTTGFVAFALTWFLLILSFLKKNKLISLLRLVFFTIILIGVVYLLFRDIINVFVMRLFVDGVTDSSGGRITMYPEIWKVFVENWAFGVGPGAYGLYMGKGREYVPSNVTLELLSTCGAFATVAFYLFVFSLIYKSLKVSKRYNCKLLGYFSLGVIMFFIILQANQNYLRLYLWMFLGMLAAFIEVVRQNEFRRRVAVK